MLLPRRHVPVLILATLASLLGNTSPERSFVHVYEEGRGAFEVDQTLCSIVLDFCLRF